MVTTHGKGQDEEKEKAGEGCTKGKATDPTGCRAFSDVVERSETTATENKKKGAEDTSGCGTRLVATHGKWQQSRRRRGSDTGRTTKGRRHANGKRGKRGEETTDPTECGAFREVAPRHETVGSKKKGAEDTSRG